MKIFKIWLILFVSTSLLLLPLQVSKGCGYSGDAFTGYSFINPKITNFEEYAPFYFTMDLLYSKEWSTVGDNISEWQNYFCDEPNKEDIDEVVYLWKIEDLENLKRDIQSVKGVKTDELKNTFAKQMAECEKIHVIDYLIFAKETEPLIEGGNWDWKIKNRDHENIKAKIESGISKYKDCASNFIKLRYAYQVIRLAHYAGYNEQCIELYDQLVPPLVKVKSIMHDWAKGRKAGALQRLGKNAESAYLFAQVFDSCPSKRVSSYLSFQINDETEWSDAMAMCKNKREKSALYVMRAINPFSHAVEEMISIYELDPKSPHLDFLLMREVQKYEMDFLGKPFSDEILDRYRMTITPRKEALSYMADLHRFVQQTIEDNKIENIDLWETVNAYLYYLGGENEEARQLFRSLKKQMKGNAKLKKQIDQFNLLLEISNVEEIGITEESQFDKWRNDLVSYREHKWAEKENERATQFVLDKFYDLYKKQGEYGKAFLCHFKFYNLLISPDLKIVEDLIALVDKPNKSKHEEWLLSRLFYEQGDEEEKNNIKEVLVEMKGTILLGNHELEQAIETFKTLPDTFQMKYWRFQILPLNPFEIGFSPASDFISPSQGEILKNKLELAESILALERKTKSDPANAAIYYCQLGAAAYNMTYEGSHWRTTDYFKSSSARYARQNNTDNVTYSWGGIMLDKDNLDLSKAIDYFQQGIARSKDPEISARLNFYLGLCQKIEYRWTTENLYENPVPKNKITGYVTLLSKYQKTEFAESVMRSCSALDYYMK